MDATEFPSSLPTQAPSSFEEFEVAETSTSRTALPIVLGAASAMVAIGYCWHRTTARYSDIKEQHQTDDADEEEAVVANTRPEDAVVTNTRAEDTITDRLQSTMTMEDRDIDLDAAASEIENRLCSVALTTASHARAVQTPTTGLSTNQQKSPFASDDEKWRRAKLIFSDLLNPDQKYAGSYPRLSVEDMIWEMIEGRYRSLWKEFPDDMEDLATNSDRGAELCIKLGINKLVAEKRYEAINNLRKELQVSCMTSTIIQVRHLVYTFGIDNPYGKKEHINDGTDIDLPPVIYESYNGKKWQSYMGIRLSPGYTQEALKMMYITLERKKLTECFVHGTNGKSLQGINDDDGVIDTSSTKRGERHDFGDGLYVTKGQYLKALCWGLDKCWPIFIPKEGCFSDNDPDDLVAYPMGHNPAIVAFPKPKQYKRSDRTKILYDVHKKDPLPHLKSCVPEKEYFDIVAEFKKYSGKNEDLNWKYFVKLARYYDQRPNGRIFMGRLHETGSKALGNTDRGGEPRMDDDKQFIQYCFTHPNKDLGEDRLFIEFDVHWNEWLRVGKEKEEINTASNTALGVQKETTNFTEKIVDLYGKA